jgi:sarcosine oxidase subunit beta
MSKTTRADRTADVVIVGAGIIGAAIALELSRAGRDVLVVDAGAGPGQGSTGASSAIVRLHYSRRVSVLAALDCYYDWTSWQNYLDYRDPGPTISFIHTGALVLDGNGPRRDCFTRHLDSLDIAWEELTAADIEERFPALDARRFGPPAPIESEAFWRPANGPLGGFSYERAGYIDDPQLAARNLCSAAQHLGARFRFRETVVGVVQRHDRTAGVMLSSGEAPSAPAVVNAAGPASDALNRLAGVTGDGQVRSRPLRTETHEIPAPGNFTTAAGGTFVTDLDLGVAFRPHAQGMLHISSIEPECDQLEWLDDPWHFDPTATHRAYTRQTLRVARRMPTLHIPHRTSGIGALYDVTPDWTPIFDRSDLDGYYLACGTSGNSFKLAPTAGRALRAIIEASESGRGAEAPPMRINAAHLDAQIDLAPFSRRRTIHQSSPNNVIA